LDPLIARLEKIEQMTQEYHLEKAAGFFFAQIQKRRCIHELWKKRDEAEVIKLGATNASHFEFGSPNNQLVSPIDYFNSPIAKQKRSPPGKLPTLKTVAIILMLSYSTAYCC
jgi:hypothetical protein